MSNVVVTNNRYTVDSLYQWDLNQDLVIHGLSLPSIPEIHFTNDAMNGAIVIQSTMDDSGVITAKIPNSLLQKPYTIKVYVCIYEGDTFESLYSMDIPVKARKKPLDYSFEDNVDELYSYNALDNKIDNTLALALARYDDVNQKYEEVDIKYNEVERKYEEVNTKYETAMKMVESAKYENALAMLESAQQDLDSAVESLEEAKADYANASEILTEYETAVEDCRKFMDDVTVDIDGKENKAVYQSVTMLASGWVDGVYSFEENFPVETYNIEIALDITATKEQAEAFNSASMVGSIIANEVKAFEYVPTIDIPIVVRSVKK